MKKRIILSFFLMTNIIAITLPIISCSSAKRQEYYPAPPAVDDDYFKGENKISNEIAFQAQIQSSINQWMDKFEFEEPSFFEEGWQWDENIRSNVNENQLPNKQGYSFYRKNLSETLVIKKDKQSKKIVKINFIGIIRGDIVLPPEQQVYTDQESFVKYWDSFWKAEEQKFFISNGGWVTNEIIDPIDLDGHISTRSDYIGYDEISYSITLRLKRDYDDSINPKRITLIGFLKK